MPCKPQWNGVNHRSNQHGSGHFSTFLTSLLSSLLYFPHFSTFFTSLLSSLLYFPHSSAFFTSPLPFFPSLLSRNFKARHASISATVCTFTSKSSLSNHPTVGGFDIPPAFSKALFEQLGGDRQGLWPHGRTGRAPRPSTKNKHHILDLLSIALK